jgi:hypothetical protein
MIRKVVFEFVYLAFAIFALTFLAPALLPGVTFNGGLLTAVALGSLLYGYQQLWKMGSDKLMGIAPGSCPMPAMMRWVILSVVVGVIVFVGALGLALPSVYAVGGVFSAILAGITVVIGEMLANIVTRPLMAIWKEKE